MKPVNPIKTSTKSSFENLNGISSLFREIYVSYIEKDST